MLGITKKSINFVISIKNLKINIEYEKNFSSRRQ